VPSSIAAGRGARARFQHMLNDSEPREKWLKLTREANIVVE
jgi:hypothetical protein